MQERSQDPSPHRMPLTVAAFRLALTYQQARTKLLRGELRGGRDEYGCFYVDGAEVERLAAEREGRLLGTDRPTVH